MSIIDLMEELPKTLPRFIYHFLKQQPLAFIVFSLTPLILVLDSNIIPYAFKLIIDGISQENADRSNIFSTIKLGLIIGGSSWLIVIIFMRLQSHWQASVIPRFQADIRIALLDHVTKHSYKYFSNQLSGNIANKINDLPRSIENIRSTVTMNIVSVFLVSIVAFVMMAQINITFSIILFVFVISNILLIIPRARKINRLSEENAEIKSQLTGVIVDTLINIVSVKLFASRKHEIDYAVKKQEEEKISNRKLIISTNIYKIFMDIPSTLMIGFTTYFLIIYWQQYKITTGDFVFIFNSSFLIINQLWQISWVMTMFFSEVGVAKQALALVNAPHEITDIPNAKPLVVQQGEIEFNNVTFHYENGAKIFNNKNIVIHPGQKVGLVGFSGSGKSTFVNLILRFFDVSAGSISIDHQNIAKVTQDSLRHNISMIPQDPSLFHRSLMENIRYGNPSASDDEVILAAKKADCHDFITRLPEGYNSQVGERGTKISGGQRQRIAIARAMLENAPILILDEATSALDSFTEKTIQKSFSLLMENKTTIVIAHRLSTLLNMDRILVFDNGVIIEDGSHQQLLNANGHYSKLWHMQVSGFLPTKPKQSISLEEEQLIESY